MTHHRPFGSGLTAVNEVKLQEYDIKIFIRLIAYTSLAVMIKITVLGSPEFLMKGFYSSCFYTTHSISLLGK